MRANTINGAVQQRVELGAASCELLAVLAVLAGDDGGLRAAGCGLLGPLGSGSLAVLRLFSKNGAPC